MSRWYDDGKPLFCYFCGDPFKQEAFREGNQYYCSRECADADVSEEDSARLRQVLNGWGGR